MIDRSFGRPVKQMLFAGLLVAASALPLEPETKPFFFSSLGDDKWINDWTLSGISNVTGEFELKQSDEPLGYPEEAMLYTSTPNSYFGLSHMFEQPLDVTDKTLVVQYETRFGDNMECGGAYIKLFGNENFHPDRLCNETKYVIMFGPDKCGDTNKVHFIFRHKNPLTGEIEEKAMTDAPEIKNDKLSHLYTLIVRPDNSFEILIDGRSEKTGTLLTDFSPSVNPPKEIDDPTDIKPADWVDEEEIDDPNAHKPEDWDESQPEYIPDPEKATPPEGWLTDEPRFIPDPEAEQPEDWDEDMYGAWEPPTVPNPKCEAVGCGEYEAPLVLNEKYVGKWTAPKIANPAYIGPWKARQIPNPNYYEDPHPHNFPEMIGVGFELWIVNKDVGFGNVYIGHDEAAVMKWNDQHFLPKFKVQSEAQKKIDDEKMAEAQKEAGEETKKARRESSGEGFQGALLDFAYNIKDAWEGLYKENPEATIMITAAGIFIPTALCGCICGGSKKKKLEEERRRKLLRKKKRLARKAKRLAAEKLKAEEEAKKKAEEEEQNEKVVDVAEAENPDAPEQRTPTTTTE